MSMTTAALRGLARFARLFPFRSLALTGNRLGDLTYACLGRRRAVAHANIARSLGASVSPAGVRRIARDCCRHLATTLVQFAWLPRMTSRDLARLVQVEGEAHLREVMERGQGAILISAHYGNWELIPLVVAARGYRPHMVMRDLDHPALTRFNEEIRRALGQGIVDRKAAARPAMECLRRNEALLVLLDQNMAHGAVWVDFFGVPAATAAGPAILSLGTGAPLLPVFAVRQPDGTFRVRFDAPLYPDPAQPMPDEMRRLTGAATGAIEAQVRAQPDQWLWFHSRWKTRPPS